MHSSQYTNTSLAWCLYIQHADLDQLGEPSHVFETRLDLLLSEHIVSHALEHAQAVPRSPSPKRFLASKVAAPLKEHANHAEACDGRSLDHRRCSCIVSAKRRCSVRRAKL